MVRAVRPILSLLVCALLGLFVYQIQKPEALHAIGRCWVLPGPDEASWAREFPPCAGPALLPTSQRAWDAKTYRWLEALVATAARGRAYRLYLLADGYPHAWVSHQEQGSAVPVVLTTGMVEFAESAARTIHEELNGGDAERAARLGIGARLESLHAAEGRTCAELRPSWSGGESMLDFMQSASALQTAENILSFVLLHEFAHIIDGADCASGSADPLVVEPACDRIAFNLLARNQATAPVDTMLWLISMHHHEAFYELEWARRTESPGQEGATQSFHVRNWRERARDLVEAWQVRCKEDPNLPICFPDWDKWAIGMDALSLFPLPKPCLVDGLGNAPAPTFSDSTSATDCIEARDYRKGRDVYWSVRLPPLVSVHLPLRNICERPVACELEIEVGTRPRPDAGSGTWAAYNKSKRLIQLEPGQEVAIDALLRWHATQERMPSLRFPRFDREREDEPTALMRCGFVGPPIQASPGSSMCEAIKQILADASKGFPSLQQEAGAQDGGWVNIKKWRSPPALSGIQKCIARPANTVSPPSISCTIDSSQDYSRLDQSYATWSTELATCLKPPLWKQKEDEEYTTSSARQWSVKFRRGTKSEYVELKKTHGLADPWRSSVALKFTGPEAFVKPSQEREWPREEILADNIESAMEKLLERSGDPTGFANLYVEISKPEESSYTEAEDCFLPQRNKYAKACSVSIECRTQEFFVPEDIRERFDKLVAHFTSRLSTDPRWKPGTKLEKKTDWSPYISDTYLAWKAYADNLRLTIDARPDISLSRNIDVTLTVSYGAESAVCQASE